MKFEGVSQLVNHRLEPAIRVVQKGSPTSDDGQHIDALVGRGDRRRPPPLEQSIGVKTGDVAQQAFDKIECRYDLGAGARQLL